MRRVYDKKHASHWPVNAISKRPIEVQEARWDPKMGDEEKGEHSRIERQWITNQCFV